MRHLGAVWAQPWLILSRCSCLLPRSFPLLSLLPRSFFGLPQPDEATWQSTNMCYKHACSSQTHPSSALTPPGPCFPLLSLLPRSFFGLPQPDEVTWQSITFAGPRQSYAKEHSMLPEARQLLTELYAPYNQRLSQLLADPSLAQWGQPQA